MATRNLPSWLVMIPTLEERMRCRRVEKCQFKSLELLWKQNPAATVDDLQKPTPENLSETPHVQLRYENAQHYRSIFKQLVKLERDHVKGCMEREIHVDVAVSWELDIDNKRYGFFKLPNLSEELRLIKGDQLRLTFCNEARKPLWSRVGSVIKLPDGELLSMILFFNCILTKMF